MSSVLFEFNTLKYHGIKEFGFINWYVLEITFFTGNLIGSNCEMRTFIT